MNAPHTGIALQPRTATHVAICAEAEGLAEIKQPACTAAIWDRAVPVGFQSWIDQLDPGVLPAMRTILRPAEARQALHKVCDDADMPDGPERAFLIDDISAMAERFAAMLDAPYLRLRLSVVTGNSCRKFHIDAVTARLICTYRGGGTQYGLGVPGTDPETYDTVPTGAPIVLLGTEWPGPESSGLLHRSPPIEGTGETRLLLVLDPMDGAEED